MQIRDSVLWTWNNHNSFTSCSVYAALVNGGKMIKPSLIKEKKRKTLYFSFKKTSGQINNILRKVVTEKEGTASLADIHGYYVGGKLEHRKTINLKMKI